MYLLGIIFAIIIVDQYIKFNIVNSIMVYERLEIIKNFFYITYVENHGIAFGLLKNKNFGLIVSTSIIISLMFYLLYKFSKTHKIIAVCIALIIGGAVGNLIDRIKFGYVIDYLYFVIFPPVFNFADAAIVCGAILMSLVLLCDKSISL